LREAGHVPFVIHPSTLINKEILLKAGGYISQLETHSITPAEDFELFDRLANYGPILVIPEPLLLYRIHSQSTSMQKFFWQKKVTRYVVARHQARLTGKKEPQLSHFLNDYDSQPVMSRLARYLRTMGQFCYRKAGLLFAEQNYLFAGWYLIMAIVVNPSYSKSRLWRQKLSPQAKESLKQSKLTRAH
jgi:predicted glycosyltransferase involved in capsule biosynthesis